MKAPTTTSHPLGRLHLLVLFALVAMSAAACDRWPGLAPRRVPPTTTSTTSTTSSPPPTTAPAPTSTAPATTVTPSTTTTQPVTTTTTTGGAGPRPWIIGYYAEYQRDLMPPSEIDWHGLTHVAVSRVVPRADGSLDTTFDYDPTNGPALARDLAARAHANGLAPILMVGGAGTHDEFAAAATSSRARLVSNLVDEMRSLGFDGLDLDWEPISNADQPALGALVSDLHQAAPGIILTVPVGWVSTTFPDVSPFYAQLANQVDRINVMSYGMAGAWDGWRTWHSSALDGAGASYPSSIAQNVDSYLKAGVPASKLGLGVGFYGTCWSGGVTGPRQDIGTSRIAADDNVMSYTNIMAGYFSQAAYHYDDAAQAPYLSFSSPHGPPACTFVSYEDSRSIAAKGAYAASRGLGGTIIWTINQAHDRAAPEGQRDSLLEATRKAFGA